jgi:hypothetical protein
MNKRLSVRGIVVLLCLVSLACAVRGGENSLITAVYSEVHNGYVRPTLADGAIKHQTYVMANGGHESGLRRDASIENVRFPGIVRIMGKHLAKQKFYPAREGKAADLLLVVYWGTTKPFDDGGYQATFLNAVQAFETAGVGGFLGSTTPAVRLINSYPGEGLSTADLGLSGALDSAMISIGMANQMRDAANRRNANLLGYMKELNERDNISRWAGAGSGYDDLMADIENERYYVVIGAYDFQEALRGKNKKLLWSTRVSIDAQGERFDERLTAMLATASRYFGEESGRLVRRYQDVPRVDLGELKTLGLVSDRATERQ